MLCVNLANFDREITDLSTFWIVMVFFVDALLIPLRFLLCFSYLYRDELICIQIGIYLLIPPSAIFGEGGW